MLAVKKEPKTKWEWFPSGLPRWASATFLVNFCCYGRKKEVGECGGRSFAGRPQYV